MYKNKSQQIFLNLCSIILLFSPLKTVHAPSIFTGLDHIYMVAVLFKHHAALFQVENPGRIQ